MSSTWQVLEGDCREVLARLPEQSAQTCVTSPPYFGLRDYGHEGQIGQEPTPDEFVAALVEVFRSVRRVLRDDGTVWLNLGDSYAAHGGGAAGKEMAYMGDDAANRRATRVPGYKPKDLIGIPWMVAFALRADGWYLRSDIIWHKPNPMPESVTDRPTKAHEYLFLLSKSPRYFYDADAIREPHSENAHHGLSMERASAFKKQSEVGGHGNGAATINLNPAGRNKRDVWTITTQPFPGAHFATFPPKLIEPCLLAGSREGDTVLDPFNGAGTTGVVALRHNRSYVGVELNPVYAQMARDRIKDDSPLFNTIAEAA
jgi:DNA modification methylase